MERDFGIARKTADRVKEGRPYNSKEEFVAYMLKRGATLAEINQLLSLAPELQ
jgi:hypothetical protein